MERVELNAHTKMSKLEGIVDAKEYLDKVLELGMTAIAITDYESVQAFMEMEKILKDNEAFDKIKIIYGIEVNLLENCRANIIVKNKEGLKNLYQLVTKSNLEYIDEETRKPKIPKEIYNKYKDGLLIGSGGQEGELFRAILSNKNENELMEIAKFYDYLEVQPISCHENLILNNTVKNEEELIKTNKKIISLGEELGKLVVATSNVHYLEKEDNVYLEMLKKDFEEIDAKQINNLHFRITEEMLQEFNFLDKEKAYEIVVTNTNKIANMCEKYELRPHGKMYPKIENAKEEIKEISRKRLEELYGKNPDSSIVNRYEYEIKTILENGFEDIYMLVHLICKKAKEDNEKVVLRGGGGASFIAYLLGIGDINPLEYSIPFETFAGSGGDREPDFDINFGTTYRNKIHEYIEELFGKDKVCYGGTIGTLADITAYNVASNYYKDGREVDIEEKSKKLLGIKIATGEHPGGLIIIPQDVDFSDFTPLQHPHYEYKEEPLSKNISTHFDYHSLDRNLLKLDLLSHYDPAILKDLEKLTGINHEQIDIKDYKIMQLFKPDKEGNINTDGLSEFESEYVKNIIKKVKPKDIENLIKISGLSHGTGVWKDNNEILIEKHNIKELACLRDDIFLYLMEQGIERDLAFEISEYVRKGKAHITENTRNREGKKKEWKEYCMVMKHYNVPDWYIESLEKILYMFPKAHSCNYVIMNLMLAWYKVYYPEEFNKVIKKWETDYGE